MADETLTEIIGNEALTADLSEAQVLVMRGLKGDAGESPRINPENNHWEVYDNDTEQWVDTGVSARGPKGDPGSGEDGGSLPEVDSSDVGKVLRVNSYAEWDALDPPVGVPDYSSADVGSVLKIYRANPNSGNSMTWGPAPTGIPGASASNTNKFLQSNGTSWVAASLPKEVPIFRHCMVADADAQVVEHTIQGYVNGDWTAVTGSYIAGVIAESGKYPVIMDYPASYPRIYKPEMVLNGTGVVFRSTDMNGSVAGLSLAWNASVAAPFTAIGDLPTPYLPQDAGKVVTVHPSGGYTLQTSAPYTIPVIMSGGVYSTTATGEDVLEHILDCRIEFNGLYYFPIGSTTSGPFGHAYFACSIPSVSGKYDVEIFEVELNGTNACLVTKYEKDIILLPPVTAADNGKVLKVVNGVWTAVAE